MTKQTTPRSGGPTKAEKLLRVLRDGRWHTTRELVSRVGHTLPVAKWKLVRWGYRIERRRHPFKRFQHQYRLSSGNGA